eukprot:SAG31_NODE_49002_length_159_cov_12.400000_1_plen_26_part_10
MDRYWVSISSGILYTVRPVGKVIYGT